MIVTGAVGDMRSWLAAADVVVAPLQLARGIQNKVLEAMAMARPVVASPAAFEGIEAVPGRDLIVADDAAAQAEAVNGLLAAPEARRRAWARPPARQMERRYRWEARLAPLAEMVGLRRQGRRHERGARHSRATPRRTPAGARISPRSAALRPRSCCSSSATPSDMASIWWNSATFNHCLLIPPIIGWLIWQRLPELRQLAPAAWWPGLLLVGAGALGWLLGEASGVDFARHLGLLLHASGQRHRHASARRWRAGSPSRFSMPSSWCRSARRSCRRCRP